MHPSKQLFLILFDILLKPHKRFVIFHLANFLDLMHRFLLQGLAFLSFLLHSHA